MTRRDMGHAEATNVVAYLNRAGMLQAMEGQAAVWKDALWGVRYADAMEACRELVRRPGVVQVKPGDLLLEVRKVRAARRGNRVPPAPPLELPADAQLAFGRAYMRALGDGASEAEADAAACHVVGAVREAITPDPGRLKELLASVTFKAPEGDGNG